MDKIVKALKYCENCEFGKEREKCGKGYLDNSKCKYPEDFFNLNEELFSELIVAAEAMEKQKPKKIIVEKSTEEWGIEVTAACPECGNDLSGEMNFCTVCGQCLLWPEV